MYFSTTQQPRGHTLPALPSSARRILRSVAISLLVALCACSGSDSGCPPCPQTETCIQGGTCALSCSPDAGNPCPAGQTCQGRCGNRTGTGCTCAIEWVCLIP